MEFIPENPLLEYHPDSLEVVRKIHNLDKSRIIQSVDIMEEWVKKQAHFKKKQFSRDYYERSIVTCKGSVEKAKSQIDKLCTLKTLLPKFFVCTDLREKMLSLTDVVCCIPLPKMTKEYQRIYLIKIFNGTINSTKFLDYYRLNVMISEYLKAHDYVNGFVLVEDFMEANLLDVLKNVNIVELQQIFTIIIGGFGARLSGIHLVSPSKLVDLFAKTLRSVLPAKIASRLYVHQNMESLYKVVDRELLPADLGGSQKSLKELQANWAKILCSEEYQQYLEDMVESRTDESARQTDKFNEKYMGLPGSFRTLTVD